MEKETRRLSTDLDECCEEEKIMTEELQAEFEKLKKSVKNQCSRNRNYL